MKIALIAIAAQFEAPYLREWIRHHLSDKVGFSDIYLYCNDWQPEGEFPSNVHLIGCKGRCQQLPAYNHFIKSLSQDYDWGMFLDCDEFLNLNGEYKNVEQMLSHYINVLGVSVNWKLFGDSGLEKVTDGNYSVLQRFTHCDKQINKHVKQMINFKKLRDIGLIDVVKFITPHCCNISCNAYCFMSANGENYTLGPWSFEDTPSAEYKHPFVGHFFCKTIEEYRYRRSFGKADTPEDHPLYKRTEAEFYEHNKNDVEDRSFLT